MIVFIAVMAAAGSAGGAQVHYYPFDDTTPVTWQLSGAREGSVVRLARPNIVARFLCGAYRGRFDFTGGFSLHVFPDRTAMVVEFLDIAPSRLVAEGTWSISEKGDVIFNWKKSDFGGKRSEKFFQTTYGECKKMKLLICFQGQVTESIILVSEEKIADPIKQAYWRDTEYVDWREIQTGLRKNRG